MNSNQPYQEGPSVIDNSNNSTTTRGQQSQLRSFENQDRYTQESNNSNDSNNSTSTRGQQSQLRSFASYYQGQYVQGSNYSNHIEKQPTQLPSGSSGSMEQRQKSIFYKPFNPEGINPERINDSLILNNNVLADQSFGGLPNRTTVLTELSRDNKLFAQTQKSILGGYLSQYTKYVDDYQKIESNQEKNKVKQQIKKQNITLQGINLTIQQKFLKIQNILKNPQQKLHKKQPEKQFHSMFDDFDYYCQNFKGDEKQFQQKRKMFLQKLLITDKKTLLQLAYNQKRFFNIRFEILKNSKIKLFRIFQPKNTYQNQQLKAEYLKYRNIWRHVSLAQVFNQNNLFKKSQNNHVLIQYIYDDKDFPPQIKARNSSSMAYSINNLQSYEKAMKKLQESKQLLQKSKNTSTSQYITIIFCIGVVHQNICIGVVQQNNKQFKQFESALKYYKKALKLIKQLQKQQIKNKYKQKLKIKSQQCPESQKNLHSSSFSSSSSSSFSTNSISCSICYYFIANLYLLRNKLEQALHWYLLALKMIQFNGIQTYFVKYAEIAQKIGQIYYMIKFQNPKNIKINKNIKLALKYYMQALLIYQVKFGKQDLSCVKMQTKIDELTKKYFQITKCNCEQQKRRINQKLLDMKSLNFLFINNDNAQTSITQHMKKQHMKKTSIQVNVFGNCIEKNDKQMDMDDFIALITNENYKSLLIQQFKDQLIYQLLVQ